MRRQEIRARHLLLRRLSGLEGVGERFLQYSAGT